MFLQIAVASHFPGPIPVMLGISSNFIFILSEPLFLAKLVPIRREDNAACGGGVNTEDGNAKIQRK